MSILDETNKFVWGAPLLILLVGTGVWLTIRLRLLQVFQLPFALKLIFKAKNDGSGDVSSFASLSTALAATVGTGNIVGVATALKAGGPGALFWMWVAAFFGMTTKYAEGLLAVKYRVVDKNGQMSGGPMYYIEKGMGKKFRPLAIMFAISAILVAFFGIGTFPQVNAIVSAAELSFGIPTIYSAIILASLVALITIGGIERISRVTTKVVPFMAVFYLAISLGTLIVYRSQVVEAIQLVINSAFSGTAAAGGFLGATVMIAIRNGVARGVFSNEAGLGSAPIAAAAAKTKWAAEQGLISMTGTFIDTIIISTMTGLALVVTGVWQGDTSGAAMTQSAIGSAFPLIGPYVLTIALILFAFTTILGWNYYGERACEYLCGVKGVKPYRYIFILLVGVGAFLKLEAIWLLADIVNGLMAIPNLIALLFLSGVVVKETNAYLEHLRKEKLADIDLNTSSK